MNPTHSKAALAALSAALLAGCAAPVLMGKVGTPARAEKVTLPVGLDVVATGYRRLLAAGDCDIPIAGGYGLDDISSLTVRVDYASAALTDDALTLENLAGTLDASSTLRLTDLEPNATATVWIEGYMNGTLITADTPATSVLDTRFGTHGGDQLRPLMVAQRLKVAFKGRPVVGKWVVNAYSTDPTASSMQVTLEDVSDVELGLDASCTQAQAISGVLDGTEGAAVFGNLIVGHVYKATLESRDAGGTPNPATTNSATFTLDPNLFDTLNGEAGQIDLESTP
ncbi:MAG: hypothetical protein VKS61_17515 [Candidatus Sericytochromatia bacterium]|nr:hypothetical protein [Candidatus Sericytochromatia bacterium]